jgi:aryl-alcohol dehydrogenase-like predicted oxidoreductase
MYIHQSGCSDYRFPAASSSRTDALLDAVRKDVGKTIPQVAIQWLLATAPVAIVKIDVLRSASS